MKPKKIEAAHRQPAKRLEPPRDMSPSERIQEPEIAPVRQLRNEATRRKRLKRTDPKTSDPIVNGHCVYFLRRKSNNEVRIGHAADFRKRLCQHRSEALGYGDDFETLAVVLGDRSTEQAVHAAFAYLRVNGRKEFFKADPTIYRWLRWLRNQSFVAISEGDRPMEARPFDEWRPSAERQIEPPLTLFGGGEYDLAERETTADDYYTPLEVVALVREGMGRIDLDPASHAQANGVHKIPRIFTIGDNGLTQELSGSVYVNPPFAGWADWADKITRELDSGRVDQLTAFAGTRSINALYMRQLLDRADAVCVTYGRVRCWGRFAAEGSNSPSSGHTLFYFGPRVDEWRAALSRIGKCLRP